MQSGKSEASRQQRTLTGYPSIDKPWLKYYDAENLNLVIPNCSVYENLACHCSDRNSVALRFFGNDITYKELFQKIDLVADTLIDLGVRKGEIISVCLLNIPEVVYLIFAINKVGV